MTQQRNLIKVHASFPFDSNLKAGSIISKQRASSIILLYLELCKREENVAREKILRERERASREISFFLIAKWKNCDATSVLEESFRYQLRVAKFSPLIRAFQLCYYLSLDKVEASRKIVDVNNLSNVKSFVVGGKINLNWSFVILASTRSIICRPGFLG